MTLDEVMRSDLVPTDAVTVDRGATVQEAAQAFAGTPLGCVVVLDEGEPVGLVTDRDLATRVVAQGRDPREVQVGEVMSAPLVTVEEGVDLLEAMDRMADERIRRLPVVDEEGALKGMITLDNVQILLSTRLFSGALMAQTTVG